MSADFTDDPVGRLFKAASDAVERRLAENPPRRHRAPRRTVRPKVDLVDAFGPPADSCFCPAAPYPPCSYCEQTAAADKAP